MQQADLKAMMMTLFGGCQLTYKVASDGAFEDEDYEWRVSDDFNDVFF